MGNIGVAAVGTHVRAHGTSAKLQEGGARAQEGAPLPCSGSAQAIRREKGLTGPMFTSSAAVGAHAVAHEISAKLQEGAPPPFLGGMPNRAEGPGSSASGAAVSGGPSPLQEQPGTGTDASLAGAMSILTVQVLIKKSIGHFISPKKLTTTR